MSLSSSEKSSMKDSSNKQSPVEITKAHPIQCIEQRIPLETPQKEAITHEEEEKLNESLKEIEIEKYFDIEPEEVQESKLTSVILQTTSLETSSTSESETATLTKMEKLTISFKETDIEENLDVRSEEVRVGASASDTLKTTSSAASSIPEIRISNTSKEKLTTSLKDINIEKNLDVPSEEVQEGELTSLTINSYLESINIGALIATSHFLTKRRPYLKRLVDEAVKLETAMKTVNNLRHEFQPCSHMSLSCRTLIPDEWYQFIRIWESFITQIGGLTQQTNVLMQNCEDNSLIIREEFVTYLDNILVASEDLGELEEICDQALAKYRSLCFNYDNYFFLLHISSINTHIKPLQERLMQEKGKFSSFEAEIAEQIKQAEEKAKDLF